MKQKFTKLSGLTLLASILVVSLLFSCNKDEDNNNDLEGKAEFIQNYFDVSGGEFVGKAIPGTNSSSLDIIGLSGNSYVLAGGSNPVSVETGNAAKKLIIGVPGVEGYFVAPISSSFNQSGNHQTIVTLLLGQGLSQNLAISFKASDGNGLFGNEEILEVNYLEAGTGLLQVSLSWDQENDVDLHLIQPDGQEIFYGNSTSTNGGELDVDSNPACNIDNINNENIFFTTEEQVEEGEYEVLVDLWANCDIEDNTNYSIVAYYDGELISTSEGDNPHMSFLQPENESHNTNPISVMKFNIPNGSGGRPASAVSNAPKAFHFNFKNQTAKPKVLSPNKM